MDTGPTCITTAGWLVVFTGLFFSYVVGIIVGWVAHRE